MSKKSLMMAAGAGVLVLALMGGGFFMVLGKLGALEKKIAEATPEEKGAKENPEKVGPLHPLDTFIVNLADSVGNRYLRITMHLELKDPTVAGEITARLSQVRDCILTIVPTKKFEEIKTAEGKTALRDEIIAQLNALLKQEAVTKIYFTEFVVQ